MWLKTQASGTGLTLMSALAPTLGFELPYLIRAGGVVVGVIMFIGPMVSYGWNQFCAASFALKLFLVCSTIPVVAIWGTYWSIVPGKTTVAVLPPPVTPSARPAPAKPKLVSNYSKMVLVCDSLAERSLNLKERKAAMANYIDIMRKIFGATAEGSVTDDEVNFSVEITQPTGIVKQDYLFKRAGDRVFVSVTNHMEKNVLAPIFLIASLASIDPDEDFAKEMRSKVEEIAKVEPGKCKFL
jgi:hypothetical protein